MIHGYSLLSDLEVPVPVPLLPSNQNINKSAQLNELHPLQLYPLPTSVMVLIGQALRRIEVNNTDDKNRTVRPRVASKDALAAATPTKLRRSDDSIRTGPLSPDKSTIRTVSRTHKSPEKPTRSPEKRLSAPQKSVPSPEKSTLGRKFASQVMQPAFEQVNPLQMSVCLLTMKVTGTVEKIPR